MCYMHSNNLYRRYSHAFYRLDKRFTPYYRIIVMLSCKVCLSQASQNCNVHRIQLPSCWRIQRCLTTSLLCWNHDTGSLARRASLSRCCFLYIVPCIIRLQNIWEICSRSERNVWTLRSTISSQLAVPWSRLKDFGNHAFSIAGPRLWNVLLGSITDCKSVGDFFLKY